MRRLRPATCFLLAAIALLLLFPGLNNFLFDEALLQQVMADFNAAGVKAGLVEYHEARWKKAVWNMPFNGMTVAFQSLW